MSVAIAAQPAPSAGVAAFLRRPARLLIGGEWVASESSVRIPVIDPATGAEVASIADANRTDVDKAVAAARRPSSAGPGPRCCRPIARR
jgi:phenylacetaldehyde dehydrogenase